MKIYKRYNERGSQWFEVDENDVIEYCEGSGYWKKGTSIDVLKENGNIWTPFSEWKMGYEFKQTKQ